MEGELSTKQIAQIAGMIVLVNIASMVLSYMGLHILGHQGFLSWQSLVWILVTGGSIWGVWIYLKTIFKSTKRKKRRIKMEVK